MFTIYFQCNPLTATAEVAFLDAFSRSFPGPVMCCAAYADSSIHGIGLFPIVSFSKPKIIVLAASLQSPRESSQTHSAWTKLIAKG
jgi:hypothetical protein